jgi:hypothetical protein
MPKTKRTTKTPAKATQPCNEQGCTCTSSTCKHNCCCATREQNRMATVDTLRKAHEILAESPLKHQLMTQLLRLGYKSTTSEKNQHRQDRALEEDFDAVADATTIDTLSKGMIESRRSHERENKLNRIIRALPELTTSNDIEKTMQFLYRTQCVSTDGSLDAELVFEAATTRCTVIKFQNMMRAHPKTIEGWHKTCSEIMKSVSKHYLNDAKELINQGMHQDVGEDPSMYAERIEQQITIYAHFAKLSDKNPDLEQLARSWIDGLSETTVRTSVSVATCTMPTYTIATALDFARVAHRTLRKITTQPTLQAMSDDTHTPGAPAPDATLIAQMITSQVAAAFHSQSLKALQDAPMNTPTPHRIACGQCHKFGHETNVCYSRVGYPPKPTYHNIGRDSYRPPYAPNRPAYNNRDRNRDRGRDDDREKGHGKDTRDKDRGKNSDHKPNHNGNRLNDKGRH